MIRTSRTEWFHRAGWGLFMHFLAEAPGGNNANWGEVNVKSWNQQVDAFDVEKLAAQLHEVKAGYFYLTLGQNSGYFCSPNTTYDRLTGRNAATSRCSRRDLVAEMFQALGKYNIPMMVYLPTHAPMHDVEATMALKCVPPWRFVSWSPKNPEEMAAARDTDSRIRTFQRNWEAIIREWSLRWGNNVRGWWFDGCYFADKIYDFPDEPNFSSFAAAVRAGNPGSMVCWNPGVVTSGSTISTEEDYTSGECNDPDQAVCLGPWVGQARSHVLSYIGKSWCDPHIRFNAAELVTITSNVTDNGGVFTWDVPFDHSNGSLTPEAFAVLRDFSLKMASRKPEPLPAIPIVNIKTDDRISPDHDEATVRITLSNPHDKAINGQITFQFNPDSAFEPLPPLEYSLDAAESTSHIVRIKTTPAISDALCAELICSSRGIKQKFHFPCHGVIRGSDISRRFPIRDAKGKTLAQIGIELKEDRLYLKGTVYDSTPKVMPVPWQGSGLELFIMPGDDFTRMRQLFLTPPDDGKPAALTSCCRNEYVALPDSPFSVTTVCDGYEIEVSIPLSSIGTPEFIGLEMQLTVSRPEGYLRRTMFGSTSAFASPENYATVKY